eukprot:UN18510
MVLLYNLLVHLIHIRNYYRFRKPHSLGFFVYTYFLGFYHIFMTNGGSPCTNCTIFVLFVHVCGLQHLWYRLP